MSQIQMKNLIQKFSISLKCATGGDRFNIDLYPTFLSKSNSHALYEFLENSFTSQWSSLTRRSNLNFGDDGVSYSINFGGYGDRPLKQVVRYVKPWKDFGSSGLKDIRDRITFLTGAKYNYCVVQRYPHSQIGIKPHRDKEMKHGTDIAGVSLGYTRILRMVAPKYIKEKPVDLTLVSGSLYILKPATNDHWMHSIEPETKKVANSVRFSLTFRYTG